MMEGQVLNITNANLVRMKITEALTIHRHT
jgi:hypothetical protein